MHFWSNFETALPSENGRKKLNWKIEKTKYFLGKNFKHWLSKFVKIKALSSSPFYGKNTIWQNLQFSTTYFTNTIPDQPFHCARQLFPYFVWVLAWRIFLFTLLRLLKNALLFLFCFCFSIILRIFSHLRVSLWNLQKWRTMLC